MFWCMIIVFDSTFVF